MKSVIVFFGYIPFEHKKGALGVRLFIAMQNAVLSLKKIWKRIQVDPTTSAYIEPDLRKSIKKTTNKYETFISGRLFDNEIKQQPY